MADDVPANALPGFRASPDFDFLDADIIIRGTSGHSWYDDPEDEGTFFRVHKAKLSALSTTFRDMFALPTTPELSTAADGTLPQMQLPESAHELSLLLPFFYDDSTKYADADHLQTDELLKLWELADKYQVHLLPHLLKKDVMRRLTRCDHVQALQVYILASRIGEHAMKKMALTRMLEGDYTSLPPDLTQSLSIAELDKLARDYAWRCQCALLGKDEDLREVTMQYMELREQFGALRKEHAELQTTHRLVAEYAQLLRSEAESNAQEAGASPLLTEWQRQKEAQAEAIARAVHRRRRAWYS